MELLQIKETIVKGIEIATKEKGYSLVRGAWGTNPHKCACALGCLLIANDKDPAVAPFNQLKEILDVSPEWLNEFVQGFDGLTMVPSNIEEARKLGEDIAKEFSAPPYLKKALEKVEIELKKENNK